MTIQDLFGGKDKNKSNGNGSKEEPLEIEMVFLDDGEEIHVVEDPPEPRTLGERIRGALLLRVILFGLGVFCAILATFSFAMMFINNICFLGTLCRKQGFLDNGYRWWLATRRWCAVTVGSAIALISPALGIGMVLVYFMMHMEDKDDSQLASTIQSQLRAAMRGLG